MTRRPVAVLLPVTLAFAVVLGACGSGSSVSLPGSQWTVISINGKTTEAEGTPTIEFGTDDKVAGTTGCNRYSGSVTIDGDKITFGHLLSTLIGCEGALGAQEQAFTAALDGATNWSVGSNGDLTIKGAGDIVARPLEQPPT
jgi:heat shock protein HslJ